MKITSHAIGTAFVEVLSNGEVRVASMNYTKKDKKTGQMRTTRRLPMGKGKKLKRESLTETQAREATQEAAENPGNFAYTFEFPRLVYYTVVTDDNNPNELHLKAFMVAKVTQGELRSHRSVDQEFGSDGKPLPEEDEILDPLVWYEVRELLNLMSAPGCGLYVHITAVLATLSALAGKYPAVASRYGSICERPEVQARIKISTEHKDEVGCYVRGLQA